MAIGVGLSIGHFNTDQDEQAFYDEKNSRLIEKWYLVRISNFLKIKHKIYFTKKLFFNIVNRKLFQQLRIYKTFAQANT